MVQKIGKLLIATVLVTTLAAQASVSLRVTDINGQEIEETGMGIPFLIDVEVSGQGSGATTPKVETNPQLPLQAQGTSSSIRTINGVTTVKKNYRYQGRAKEEGVYAIGPALIEDDGTVVESDTVRLSVSRDYQQINYVNDDAEVAFVEITTPRDTVFRGERIPFSIRFYQRNDDVHIDHISEPKFANCTATRLRGPVTGKEKIDDVTYRYLEWNCSVYPNSVGELLIPSVAATITVPEPAHQRRSGMDIFSMMDQMLGGPPAKRQQLYSNALTIQVKDLPHHDPPVVAVGSFSGLTAKLNMQNAVQGEGIVLTLELVGAGNFSMITHPLLELPDGLKYYDSNTKMHKLAQNVSKKDFEYVVQGLKPGNYTIEPQTFTFFDIKKKQYVTLRTKPTKCTIAPGAQKEEPPPVITQEDKEEQAEIFSVEAGLWRFRQPRSLPWPLFCVLSLLPLLYVLSRNMLQQYAEYQERNAPHYGYKNAARHARDRIAQCKKDGEVKDLYTICIAFFAARLRLPQSEISETRIEQALQSGGMDAEEVGKWKLFFADLSAANFADAHAHNKEKMCTMLEEWITRLEQVV